ncbi:hypothetical protein CK203_004465 [Vitis vinifera]|uniref:HAT C-terminal dimerisation domain-containing protein n=1 Tax=Vitis vinifera TaxID=29760 RepID=A0A438KFI5_VITVI|nr:hypothetical protein CK203_004465 [Vitis vinifera]
MFKHLDEVVEEIGEENVVQVITDNASNYVNVGMRLMEKMRRLWWTPCAARCIDLMLEDVGKLNVHANTLLRARQVTTIPLVSVLREADSEERPAMGYIYELMDSAKEKIAFNCGVMERKYGPIWRKIYARWTPQLHWSLHAAGYYLNPQLRNEDNFSNVDEMRFGGSTPELQKFVVRVLSLICSASGCERNWSTFESIHTKKRNRLEHKRLNALVYVRYNTRLRERSLQRKQNVDLILVDEIDSNDEWIVKKENPLLPLDLCWLEDNELFNVDAIRIVSSQNQETQASSDNMVSSHSYKRKHDEFASKSGGQGKGKELNLTPIHEDEELDELEGFDSGNFPTIDTLDEDDDDIGEDDLS